MLTKQESNVLSYIGVGLSDKEVADTLNIATTTAVKHKQNIMQKLGVSKATELVVYYWGKKSNIEFDLTEIRKQAITLFLFACLLPAMGEFDTNMHRAKRIKTGRSKTRRESII